MYVNGLYFLAVCVLASLENVHSGKEKMEEVKTPELLYVWKLGCTHTTTTPHASDCLILYRP